MAWVDHSLASAASDIYLLKCKLFSGEIGRNRFSEQYFVSDWSCCKMSWELSRHTTSLQAHLTFTKTYSIIHDQNIHIYKQQALSNI